MQDDTASDPQDDQHLPVSGEFDDDNVPDQGSALTSSADEDDDLEAATDDEGDIMDDEDELSDEDDGLTDADTDLATSDDDSGRTI